MIVQVFIINPPPPPSPAPQCKQRKRTFSLSAVSLYHNSVLSHFAVSLFYDLSLFAIYMNQELFKVFISNNNLKTAYAASQTTVLAYEKTQSNQVSEFRNFVCSLFPKAVLFDFYFTLL